MTAGSIWGGMESENDSTSNTSDNHTSEEDGKYEASQRGSHLYGTIHPLSARQGQMRGRVNSIRVSHLEERNRHSISIRTKTNESIARRLTIRIAQHILDMEVSLEAQMNTVTWPTRGSEGCHSGRRHRGGWAVAFGRHVRCEHRVISLIRYGYGQSK
jgi:hypothetical protein